MQNMLNEVRLAVRRLSKSLGFSLTIVLTLALGVGANVGVFTIVNSVLLRPLPFPHAENIVVVMETVGKAGLGAVSTYDYEDWKAQSDVFSDLAAYNAPSSVGLSFGSTSVRVPGEVATENYFTMLGARAVVGRGFTASEVKTPGDSPVALISYDLWQKEFGGLASAVGRAVRINDAAFTIVGVMAPGFKGFGGGTQLWVPFTMRDALWPASAQFDFLHNRGIHWHRVIGRLKPGVSVAQAQQQMQTIAARLEKQYPDEDKDRGVKIYKAVDALTASTRLPLFLLLGSVTLLLLIACMNIANMLLSRAKGSQRETAIRIALGASTGEVARHFFIETMILCAVGTVLGSAGAMLCLSKIIPMLPLKLPKYASLEMDWRVLLFAAGLAMLTALALTISPAIGASRLEINSTLHEGGRSSRTRKTRRFGSVLVVVEVALAMILLSATGLLLRTLVQLHSVNLGFNPDHLVTLRIEVPAARYGAEKSRMVPQQLVERLRAYPGVESASATMADLYEWPGINRGFSIEGKPAVNTDEGDSTYYQEISPAYFRSIGVPLLEGREFKESDTDKVARVIVVSKSFAEHHWPGEDAVGKRVKFGPVANPKQEFMQVVGVAADYRSASVRAAPGSQPIFYGALAQSEVIDELSLVVRTRGDAQSMIEPLRKEIQRFDPAIPVLNAETLMDRVAESTANERAYSQTLGAFALLALLLAAIGIYGVISYGVAMRTGEIGVRMALGAQRQSVLRMLLRESGALLGGGLLLGAAGVLLTGGVLRTLLYQTNVYDPVALVVAGLMLGGVGLLGSLVPALRAMRIDPLQVLRNL